MKKMKMFALLGTILIATSCKKDEPVIVDPIDESGPSATALTNFINNNIEDRTQHFTVDANATILVTGANGTTLSLGANMLEDASGNPVIGNVDISLIEIDTKADMVLLDKSTNGLKANGDHSTLISAGEFFVTVTQGGEELVLLEPMKLKSPVREYDDEMRKFVDVGEEDLLWGLAEDSLLELIDTMIDGRVIFTVEYGILPGEWGWTNIDKFYNDPRPKTMIYAELPVGFDNTNTEVYISYNGESNALANFDVWEDGRFTEHYGLIPIGLEVNFVAVAIIDGVLNYVIQPTTIVDNHVEEITGFTSISEDELTTLINDLP